MTSTPTLEEIRNAADLLEGLSDNTTLRHGASIYNSYFFQDSAYLRKIADHVEAEEKAAAEAAAKELEEARKAAEARRPKISARYNPDSAGVSVYVDIPGKDEVVAVYVGSECAPSRDYYVQTLDGSASSWGNGLLTP